jgi:hypothetical protein
LDRDNAVAHPRPAGPVANRLDDEGSGVAALLALARATWGAPPGNAWRYGFVMSYPADASPDRTCYKPEAWHYRYVGPATAAAVFRSGLSLREWLWAQGR